ncbi:GNAT family N-acetyltransferase [Alkalihalophilus pseudofirmus]|uniref:GNAT family N-acetyltransferase n=1 Tax=Alkalihalophilus pseudofirmus TaxID=79885 RepID=A0AAJ2NQF0_ALKPS|nr:GNAT family N-acetyltransferase [Alkalihalophilus pseudofirmus]MDV2886714.1 GNAT family N-acetyltransferase [Alkalihalophilus pseudofirmus]
MDEQLLIRETRIEDVEKVSGLLNKVTKDLIKRGINQWEYPFDRELLLEQARHHHSYVVTTEEKEIIGTFCIKDIEQINDLSLKGLNKYLYQLAIIPDYQGKNAGAVVLSFAYKLVKNLNTALYLDCWAGNEKLKKFYLRNGMTYIGDFQEEGYFISVFTYNHPQKG